MNRGAFPCERCGVWHDDLPLAYSASAPAGWRAEYEHAGRGILSDELCDIDDELFYVAGQLPMPVLDAGAVFAWGVWVNVDARSYRRITELWDSDARRDEPPSVGRLATALPVYPSTLDLRVAVQLRRLGERPLIELEPTRHPLSVEQRRGITLARVCDFARALGTAQPHRSLSLG